MQVHSCVIVEITQCEQDTDRIQQSVFSVNTALVLLTDLKQTSAHLGIILYCEEVVINCAVT